MTAEKTVEAIVKLLADKRAINVETINLEGKTILADWFVIASGTSVTHIKTLVDEVEYGLKMNTQLVPDHIEGYSSGRWVLMDYGHVIVHIFHSEERQFYNLEKLWQGQRASVV